MFVGLHQLASVGLCLVCVCVMFGLCLLVCIWPVSVGMSGLCLLIYVWFVSVGLFLVCVCWYVLSVGISALFVDMIGLHLLVCLVCL